MQQRKMAVVEASARLLTSRFHKGLPFGKAKRMIERNRRSGKPMLYAGANYDVADFLATGCESGVFIDPQYNNRYPSIKPNRDSYAEDFIDDLKRAGADVSGFSLQEIGDIGKDGKWVMGFSFCGEKKSVVCYGRDIRSLAFADIAPKELEGGIAHYTAVHYPTEWSAYFIYPEIVGRVIPGGHVETWLSDMRMPFFDALDFELCHKNSTRGPFEKLEMTYNGVSIYDRIGSYVILRRKGRSKP